MKRAIRQLFFVLVMVASFAAGSIVCNFASGQTPLAQRPVARKPAQQTQAPRTQNRQAPNTQAPRAATAKQPVKKIAPPPADLYILPTGTDSKAYLRCLNQLLNYQPRTKEAAAEYESKAPKIMNTAAKSILKLEKDPNSPLAKYAKQYLLAVKLVQIKETSKEDKNQMYREIRATLKGADVKMEDLEFAIAFGESLESAGETRLAAFVYEDFGKLLATKKAPIAIEVSELLAGSARRLTLVGKPINVAGTHISGKTFDWSKYKGRVVLVQFWATWCPNCLREMPVLAKHYQTLKKRGFEIVSISLDENRQKLDAHLAKNPIPWTVIHDKDGLNPTAEHYAISSLPASILVDQRGTVVSVNASGAELEGQLARLLGLTARK